MRGVERLAQGRLGRDFSELDTHPRLRVLQRPLGGVIGDNGHSLAAPISHG